MKVIIGNTGVAATRSACLMGDVLAGNTLPMRDPNTNSPSELTRNRQ